MRTAVEHELHALPWRTDRPGAHAARIARALTLARSRPATAARSR